MVFTILFIILIISLILYFILNKLLKNFREKVYEEELEALESKWSNEEFVTGKELDVDKDKHRQDLKDKYRIL